MDEITITRTDYTCDCAKYNFRKVNTLNAKIRGKIEKKDGLEYIVFGRKGKSARVLRYYDKKKEILTRGTSFLYTDYFGYSEIMRYELPVFSPQEQENIGNIVISITEKLRLNRAINHNLATLDHLSTRAGGSHVA